MEDNKHTAAEWPGDTDTGSEPRLGVLTDVAAEVAAHADKLGFWTTEIDHAEGMKVEDLLVCTKIALIMTELAEALEEYRRNGATDHFGEELGDVIIRTIDLAGRMNYDIGAHVDRKITINRARPYRHGKRF